MKKLIIILVISLLSNYIFCQVDSAKVDNTIECTCFILKNGGKKCTIKYFNDFIFKNGSSWIYYSDAKFRIVSIENKKNWLFTKKLNIMKKSINVISLFNGMGTLRQAFFNLGIKINKYYSSEIKKFANELQQHHFPDVVQVGDINNWRNWDIDWETIDFIGSGSPCQDLSAAGKRAGLFGSRSSLFFVFIDILNHVKKHNPNVLFLQENVGSATKKDIGIMSRELGVYPVRINSSLVTAQLRDRYYWTNIRTKNNMFDIEVDIPQPKNKKIRLNDILTSGKSEKEKHTCLNTGSGNSGTQRYLKHRNATTGMITIINEESNLRTCNKIEMCRLQGFPDDYCDTLTNQKAGSLLGDGWTLPVIEHILSFINFKN
jgi:site-specific DNA-cytosine methylase